MVSPSDFGFARLWRDRLQSGDIYNTSSSINEVGYDLRADSDLF